VTGREEGRRWATSTKINAIVARKKGTTINYQMKGGRNGGGKKKNAKNALDSWVSESRGGKRKIPEGVVPK